MTKIEILISDDVYAFVKRYYTNSNDIGLNLMEAISEQFVIQIGKNYKLSDVANEHLQKFLASEKDTYDEFEDYSDI